MKLAIGSDHAGFKLKERLKAFLEAEGHKVKDYGTDSEASVDYPDFAHPLSNDLSNNEHDLGVLVCGSANGVAMTANKHQNVRAAITWNEETASLARQHNDANVICLPARFVSEDEAIAMLKVFINTKYEGGRHNIRLDKMSLF
jgi:ribose 5-phosphate isomerase B